MKQKMYTTKAKAAVIAISMLLAVVSAIGLFNATKAAAHLTPGEAIQGTDWYNSREASQMLCERGLAEVERNALSGAETVDIADIYGGTGDKNTTYKVADLKKFSESSEYNVIRNLRDEEIPWEEFQEYYLDKDGTVYGGFEENDEWFILTAEGADKPYNGEVKGKKWDITI